MQYLFIFGSTPKLSFAELKQFLLVNEANFLSPEVLLVDLDDEFVPEKLMEQLGGTVKIAKVVKSVSSKNIIEDEIANCLLSENDDKRLVFGISIYGANFIGNQKSLPKIIKSKIENGGKKVRFVLPQKDTYLSSVQVSKEKIKEVILISKSNSVIIGRTIVVQNFEEWGKRDFKRPFADSKSGMLPVKVARMMVNLAFSNEQRQNKDSQNLVVLDPFCGMGTIGMESLASGFWSINSDKDKETMTKAEKNLQWFCDAYKIPGENFNVFNIDATNISSAVPKNSVDAVITEPYLGPAIEFWNNRPVINSNYRLTPGKLLNIITGLEKMYIGSLKDWLSLLKPGGKVVIIFPSYYLWDKEYGMKNIVDTCEKIGYNIITGPIVYSRPQAVVKRLIYVLEVKKS